MTKLAPRPRHLHLNAQQRDFALAAVCCALFYVLTGHDDLLETSNHAWLLLDCIRSGRFFQFYTVVMEHNNTFYYVNNAHYNIVCYLLYAVWQLPVYLAAQLAHLSVSEYFLMFWSKAVGTAAFAGCVVLLRRLALGLGLGGEDAHAVSLALLLDPVAFFAVFLMGQYDSLCLVFLLAALLCWQRGQLWRFSLWTGAAMAFKFFPLLLFLPLLVLVEKRPLRCLEYAAATLWLLLPTALLFRGRTGDMDVFNGLMTDRVFAVRFSGGIEVPAFLLLYAVLLLICYFYRPADRRALALWMPWLGLAVYGGLFLFVEWHPQWLLLAVPFMVLTTFQQRQRTPWFYLQALWFFGFWAVCNFRFPGQLEANLLDNGPLGGAIRALTTGGAHNNLSFYLALVPRLSDLAPVIFAAPLAAAILLKCPAGGKSLADRLAGANMPLARGPAPRTAIAANFVLCILLLWAGTAAFVLGKAFGWL